MARLILRPFLVSGIFFGLQERLDVRIDLDLVVHYNESSSDLTCAKREPARVRCEGNGLTRSDFCII